MLAHPALDDAFGLGERLAHGRAAIGDRLEPNGKTDRLFGQTAGAIRNFLAALLDASGRIADFTDLDHGTSCESPRECWADLRSIPNHPHLEIVANAFFLGAFDDKVLQHAIDRIGNAVGLFLRHLARAEGIGHRPGLIDHKDKAGRIASADLG